MFAAFVVIIGAVVNLFFVVVFFYKGHILDKLNQMADQQACESQ